MGEEKKESEFQKFRKLNIYKGLGIILLVLIAIVYLTMNSDVEKKITNALENRNYQKVVSLYNKKIYGQKDDAHEWNDILKREIDTVYLEYCSGNVSYEEANKWLSELEDLDEISLSINSSEKKLSLFLAEENYSDAIILYNERLVGEASLDNWQNDFIEGIENTVSMWISEEMEYEDAVNILQLFESLQDSDIKKTAQKKQQYITLEHTGSELHQKAEEYYRSEEYLLAMEIISGIDPEYSQYDVVNTLYENCKDILLSAVDNPTTIEVYEKYISVLQKYISIVKDSEFTALKDKYSERLVILKDIQSIFDKADQNWKAKNYSETFANLEAGCKKYPKEDMITKVLEDYHNQYIIQITQSANTALAEKKYTDAKTIVAEALEVYSCNELSLLLESVEEQSSLFYRAKTGILDVFHVLGKGWEQEKCKVQTDGAGAYICKSGKKMALGDYTDDDITVLSFGGNIIASLANLDFLFDLRDLSYDITHWGEEEYFAVYLAADVVALLPVIGVLKYFKYTDKIADSSKATGDLADVAHDIMKDAENAADVIDDVSDAAKHADTVTDIFDEVSDVAKQTHTAADAAKQGDTVADAAKDVAKHYEHVKTPNETLVNQIHETTGVPFKRKYLEYSDGRLLEGVFPEFDSFSDIYLPENLYKESFDKQKKYLIEELKRLTDASTGDKSIMKRFSAEELADIQKGILPEGFVWHHNEKEGLMQLVDFATHDAVAHKGGMSLWGQGYK